MNSRNLMKLMIRDLAVCIILLVFRTFCIIGVESNAVTAEDIPSASLMRHMWVTPIQQLYVELEPGNQLNRYKLPLLEDIKIQILQYYEDFLLVT